MNTAALLAMWTPSGFELIVIAIIALLLFGKRLPEVARSLGKGVVEFKKGLKGIEEDVDRTPNHSSSKTTYPPDRSSHENQLATPHSANGGSTQSDGAPRP